ncbi:Hypothetical predicted protein, partial [Olea europaea subsp. europaea]
SPNERLHTIYPAASNPKKSPKFFPKLPPPTYPPLPLYPVYHHYRSSQQPAEAADETARFATAHRLELRGVGDSSPASNPHRRTPQQEYKILLVISHFYYRF